MGRFLFPIDRIEEERVEFIHVEVTQFLQIDLNEGKESVFLPDEEIVLTVSSMSIRRGRFSGPAKTRNIGWRSTA